MDTVSGELRLTFGWPDLLRGISFLVAVIGLFGIGELLLTVQEELKFKGVSSRIEVREIFKALARLPHYWVTFVRSALVGVWMGITPGGPTAASFMSYGLGRRFGKYGRKLRQGRAGRRHRARSRRPFGRHLALLPCSRSACRARRRRRS